MFHNCIKENLETKENEFTIFTENVRLYKGSPVLVVGNNKVVFIRACDVKKARASENEETIADGFVVRINPKYFKNYTFKNDFEDFCFEKEDTIEDLLNASKEQENNNICYSLRGHIHWSHPETAIYRL